MIFGNTEKIRQYDLKILNEELGQEFEDTLLIEISTLNKMKDFVIKYEHNLYVFLCDCKIVAFALDLLSVDYSVFTPYKTSCIKVCFDGEREKTSENEKFLKNKNLSAYIVVSVKDKFDGAVAYINCPNEVETIKVETVEFINKYGIVEKIKANAKYFANARGVGYETSDTQNRAILVGVGRRNTELENSLMELQSLCETDNIEVVEHFMQTKKFPEKHTYIGVGKLPELASLIEDKKANLIILDDEVTGQCKSILEDELGVKVLDRSALILDIFAKHAVSNEGRLQVSLAQMKYNYSRLDALNKTEGKFGGGGVGMRGPGETKMELSKRIIKEKIYRTEKEIEKLKAQRELRRSNRKQNREKIVALVGYTNVGKSTLLNALTKSTVLAENKLFATLDTTTRELFLAPDKKVLAVDTVGFISKLPHEFIDAFSSTLEESLQANLLLIVVDNSSKNAKLQLDVVYEVLEKLKANNIPRLIVANKSEQSDELSFDTDEDYVIVSAKTGKNLDKLKTKIMQKLF